MAWISLSAAVSADHMDELEDFLWDQGAVSVTAEDAGDEPLFEPAPEETPLWEEIRVTGLFESSTDVAALKSGLEQAGFQLLGVEEILDRAWEREWLTRFKPMQFGKRLWICPSTYELPEQDKVVVHLDPGLAFGTGTHATTNLCLSWLDSQDLEGKTLMDYGCGSGILAIAAALLGCTRVFGIDNDPQALTASRNNCEKNRVEDRITLFQPSFFQPSCFQPKGSDLENPHEIKQSDENKNENKGEHETVDYLVANILAKPLLDLKERLLSYLHKGSHIALCGIMDSQKEWVLDAYKEDVEFEPVKELEGWVLLTGKRI